MGKSLNKVKTSITALWVAIISFPYKIISSVAAQGVNHMQTFYWVMSADKLIQSSESVSTISTIINVMKFSQILLAIIVFVVWIINLIKIRKIEDKIIRQKKKK